MHVHPQEQKTVISDVAANIRVLTDAMRDFNNMWPKHVVDGCVWRLPLLSQQRSEPAIPVEALIGTAAVSAAVEALAQFHREAGQAPGTVMRLPGWFALNRSVVPELLALQSLKDNVSSSIESTRLELGAKPRDRTSILRQACGHSISMKQLERSIQGFDAAPRLVVFTWAGHTAGVEHIPIGRVREHLEEQAQIQSGKLSLSDSQTPAGIELRNIANLPASTHLVEYKTIAPHPRAMLYFSDSTRYDAMIHANLPMFFMYGQTEVRPLGSFDTDNRSKQRPDSLARTLAVPSMNLYLKGEGARTSKAPAKRHSLHVVSTYRKSEAVLDGANSQQPTN